MIDNLRFYTLCYLDENTRAENDPSKDFKSQIEVYVKCCDKLNKSIRLFIPGCNLTVLTNCPDKIMEICPDLDVIRIPFSINVPIGIRFYATHFKVDVFKYLSCYDDSYSILLDNDVVCINELPEFLRCRIADGIPTYYDITRQMAPACGINEMAKSKKFLDPSCKSGMWTGGEYLGGTSEFFGKLHKTTSSYIEKYFSNYKSLCHVGEEMLTSTAIENLLNNDEKIIDVGPREVIGRFWSCKTMHEQFPLSYYSKHCFLHIPSSKNYLASSNVGAGWFSDFMVWVKKTCPSLIV